MDYRTCRKPGCNADVARKPGPGRPPLFCPDHRPQRAKGESLPHDRTCSLCGQQMASPVRVTPTPFCSTCRRQARPCPDGRTYQEGCRCDTCAVVHRNYMREYQRLRAAAGRPIGRLESRECGQCGVAFQARVRAGSRSKFCSPACVGLSQQAVGRERSARRWIAPAVRQAIYRRDGWTCQICGESMSGEYSPDDPWSPSLDHIVPRSKGGSDDLSNLRAAHVWCNSARKDESYYTDADFRLTV